MECIKYIQQGGRDFFSGGGPEYGKWPFNHIFVLNISLISGLKLFEAAYWFPSIICTLGSVFFYLMAKTVYYNRRAALLTLLTFNSFYLFSWIHHSVHPEYLGITFIAACLYIYFKRLQYLESAMKYTFMALLFMVATAFTNITSNTFLAVFFITMLLSSVLFKLFRVHNPNLTIKYRSILFFAAATIIICLVYWIYIAPPMFERYVDLLTDLRKPAYYPLEEAAILGVKPRIFEPIGLREDLSGWGHPFYAVLFGGIMLYEVFKQRKCERRDFDLLFTLWAGFGFVMYLLTGLFPIAKYSASHLGNRVQPFIYPFMLMSVAHVGLRINSRLKEALLGFLILGFLVVNVASWHQVVPSNMFGRSFHPPDYGDNQQERTMMNYLLPVVGKASTTVVSYGMAYYFKSRYGGMPYIYADVFENNLIPLIERKFNYVAMRSQNPFFAVPFPRRAPIPKPLDKATLALIPRTPFLEKVYDNQEWVIYHVIRY
jgi:hypothetical protein